MRYFEKVSFNEFKKYYGDNIKLYEDYKLPVRATLNSAGYDFFLIEDIIIKPGEIKKIPTGYKSNFESDEMLMLCIRSSIGFKYNVRLTNQLGIIESDYYNNIDNEGHMFISLQNEGDNDFVLKKGDAYVQGIFVKFLKTDDDYVDKKRISGIGSTTRKEGIYE